MRKVHVQSIFTTLSMLGGFVIAVVGTVLFFSGHPVWGSVALIFGTFEMGFALKYSNSHPI
jgi:hypothetical protein